jgi:hypothetical protein
VAKICRKHRVRECMVCRKRERELGYHNLSSMWNDETDRPVLSFLADDVQRDDDGGAEAA